MAGNQEDGIEECEGCGAHISWVDPAYSCESGCTFCTDCAEERGHVCPNCSDELRMRSPRAKPLPK